MLRKLFKSREARARTAAVPDGERYYAIGDVHGRLDLLEDLLARIAADDQARPPAETHIVFLGDLIDRGPESAAVLDRVDAMVGAGAGRVRALLGNHEEVMSAALAGNKDALRAFCRIGGRETILSYGLDEAQYETMDYTEVAAWLRTNVPAEHRQFIAEMEDLIVAGDYAFVHAGIRPGVPLEYQHHSDLRWIREPFLSFRGGFAKVIVHGHTIVDEVDRGVDRIGIDTGAYLTDRLTALALEGSESWLLQTG